MTSNSYLRGNPQPSPSVTSWNAHQGCVPPTSGRQGAGLRAPNVTTGRRARSVAADSNVPAGVSGPVGASESGFLVYSLAWASVRRKEDPGSWGGCCQNPRVRMALSTTVSQRKMIRRKAPRGFLKRVFKRQKPHLRLETSSDLLVRFCPFIDWQWGGDRSGK